jgi:hypothetical protein
VDPRRRRKDRRHRRKDGSKLIEAHDRISIFLSAVTMPTLTA